MKLLRKYLLSNVFRGAGGEPTGGAAGGAAPGGAESASTPTDAGPGDGSFSLSDDVMGSDDLDQITIPGETPGEAPAEAAPPTPGAAAPAAPAAAKPAAAAPPAPAQAAPAAPAPAQQQQAPPQPTGTGAAPRQLSGPELVQQLQQNKETLIDALATQRFKLSDKDVADLDVDAVNVIPRLLARVYYDAAVNTIQQIGNMVPRIVESVASSQISEQRNEDAFAAAWPDLNLQDAQHARVVQQAANMYRQMNPQASTEDAIRAVGTFAMTMLQITPKAPSPTTAGGRAAVRPNGGQRPRGAQPFTPASGGAPVPVATVPQPGDAFAGMGLSFDDQ